MYKKTAKSKDHMKRTGSSATTPRLTAQDDDGLNADGTFQLAMTDGRFTSELARQELLKKNDEVELNLAKLNTMIANAKYAYKTRKIATDPRLLNKWEMECNELKRKSQEVKREMGYVNRMRKIENSIAHNMQFIEVAREVLHPDVFNKIQNMAAQRATQKQIFQAIHQLI